MGALRVRLPYAPFEHLGQVYAGFEELERQGVVALEWAPVPPEGTDDYADLEHMILRAEVDGQVVRYDLNDGLNTFGDPARTVATYAGRRYEGYFFRRSHHPDLVAACGDQVAMLPLGVNYYVKAKGAAMPAEVPLAVRAKELVRRIPGVPRLLRVDSKNQRADAFEAGPELVGPHRVLLSTRLWDPEDPAAVEIDAGDDRRRVNESRIELVTRARERFGDLVTAGFARDPYTAQAAPGHLLLPPSLTAKDAYLRQVREHSICIASRGLHDSTGWRFGEYVAASRAIVTETLAYDPGPALRSGRNYLEFDTVDEALDRVASLLDDPDSVTAMMVANRRAYELAIRPDALVLRTLLIATGRPDPVADATPA